MTMCEHLGYLRHPLESNWIVIDKWNHSIFFLDECKKKGEKPSSSKPTLIDDKQKEYSLREDQLVSHFFCSNSG